MFHILSKVALAIAILGSPTVRTFRPLHPFKTLQNSPRAGVEKMVSIASEYDYLGESIYKNDTIIHLNHAGASPSPPCVLNTVIEHMELEQRLGGYAAASLRDKELNKVYEDVARLIHASSPTEIALVESATVAWTRLFYSMVDYQTKQHSSRRKVILLSEAEYAANVVAACQWARSHNDWTLLHIPSSENSDGSSTGIVDMEVFQSMLDGSYEGLDSTDIAMVCVTHIPTNSGIVNPVEEMGHMITDYNDKHSNNGPQILYLVDACQSVGQMNVDVQQIRCHGLTATGRKYLRGPRGTGFLFVRDTIVDLLTPSHWDHACAPVTQVPSTYPPPFNVEDWIDISLQPGAKRFEFWESNVAGKLGLGEAVRYALDEMGIEHIRDCCALIVSELTGHLSTMDRVELHHESSCGIVTFSLYGVDATNVKERLWKREGMDGCRLEVSVVPATSTPLDSARCRVPDLVRASVSYTTSLRDIEVFCKRLESIIDDQ